MTEWWPDHLLQDAGCEESDSVGPHTGYLLVVSRDSHHQHGRRRGGDAESAGRQDDHQEDGEPPRDGDRVCGEGELLPVSLLQV